MERLRLADYVRYVDDRKRMFWTSFWGGVARGVGMAVGFTILGAVLVLILQDLAKHNLAADRRYAGKNRQRGAKSSAIRRNYDATDASRSSRVPGGGLGDQSRGQGVFNGKTIRVLPGLLELRLTHNDGMALGILSGNLIAGIFLPLAVVIGGWSRCGAISSQIFTRVSMGLILGGFLGNFWQRLTLGYVVDMIYLPFLPWFVCNVADVAICFGVAMLVISLLLVPGDWREKDAKDCGNREA